LNFEGDGETQRVISETQGQQACDQ